MRRLCLIVLVAALSAPVGALAASRTPGDGSLVVNDTNGTIIVQGKGVIYGHFDQGTLIVLNYKADDSTDAVSVSGARLKGRSYTGVNVRFLFPSGSYTLELIATGINLSAVGKGSIAATGVAGGTDAVNGGKQQALTAISNGQAFGKN